jgi:hypothetical protein
MVDKPADLIAKMREPILVIIGKKDMQTDWQARGGLGLRSPSTVP